MYESLLMDENDKIVHWDFDPMRRELREYVDIACGCDEQTYGIHTPQFEYRYCTGKIKMPFAKSDYLANDDIIATVMGLGAGCREILVCAGLYLRLCRNLV